MLLVVIRTGAEPTFVGGGELARDIEAEVIEALSDTTSLVGLLGRSTLETDAKLACRDGGKVDGNIEVTEVGVALPPLGVSVFGVDVSRRLLVTFRASGDWIAGVIVLVGSGGNAVGATDLETVSAVTGTFGFVGNEIFKTGGAGRLSTTLLAAWAD
jgi:hypothetical protein